MYRPSSKMKDRKVFKVTLRTLTGQTRPIREKVYEVLGKCQAIVNNIREIPNGFTAITDNQATADLIFDPPTIKALKGISLEPILPPPILALRTLTLKSIPEYVAGKSAEEMSVEILAKNTYFRLKPKVIKLPNARRVIKIVTPNTMVANKVLEDGLILFNIKIPTFNINREKYEHVNACLKCYKLEDHPTKACPSKEKVCSECTSTGHTFKECTVATKKCLNCTREGKSGDQVNHRTLAAKCPVMKRKMHEKINMQNNPPPPKNQPARNPVQRQSQVPHQSTTGRTYAGALNGNLANVPNIVIAGDSPPTPGIKLDLTKMILVLGEAYLYAAISGSHVGAEVSKQIKAQFGIELNFPNRDPATLIDWMRLRIDGQEVPAVPSYGEAAEVPEPNTEIGGQVAPDGHFNREVSAEVIPPTEDEQSNMEIGDVNLANKRARSSTPEKTQSPKTKKKRASKKPKKTEANRQSDADASPSFKFRFHLYHREGTKYHRGWVLEPSQPKKPARNAGKNPTPQNPNFLLPQTNHVCISSRRRPFKEIHNQSHVRHHGSSH